MEEMEPCLDITTLNGSCIQSGTWHDIYIVSAGINVGPLTKRHDSVTYLSQYLSNTVPHCLSRHTAQDVNVSGEKQDYKTWFL